MSKSNKAMPLSWTVAGTPAELTSALRVLGKRYPIVEGGKGTALKFEKTGKAGLCEVSLAKDVATVSYASANMALRAVGSLLAGLIPKGGSVSEECPFSTFGIMLDCSRNAVMRPEHFKGWLEGLALLGYNMAMLYTEDTYELDGEPRFGFLRGAYRTDELRDIDAYAASLGIEMIPCIQTLGHLERILGKPEYREVRDTTSVLLVDEPKTYELIERMVSHWATVFRSRRIHIGMDETHDLGRGRFYDRHGDERHFDIFNRHLGRVVSICKAKGLSPIIWSDMYFSMGSKTMNYYDKDGVIPGDVVKSIPHEASLVYWDYYHADKAFYL
ncbi:MAG: beta-N-acetylhexosaminidase, partial [Lentisphaeria bacterium]